MSFSTTSPRIATAAVPSVARVLFALLERLACGRLELVCPDGQRLTFAGDAAGPAAKLVLHDWHVCRDILRAGDIGFAEAYAGGRCTTPDLAALLELAALNQAALERAVHGSFWGTLAYRIRHWLRPNTRRGSRRNIHAHYDLGNAFYALWLDETMTYSAALFEGDATRPLAAAQDAKYARILRELGLGPGDRVLEIGCGWGGFAEYAAARGCRVTGITVSQAQLEFAQRRIARAGLADRVTLELRDYRDLAGEYDAVVSIEMFEAVGERYWPGYFAALRDRLAPGGRALVQTITIAEEKFERYRSGTDFIQQYIFPGGMLPSPVRFAALAGAAGLEVAGTHAFGLDYAATLRLWRERFDAARTAVAAQGFDETFRRLWRFYLAYCEAGFRSGSTDVLQVHLRRR